MLQFKSYLNPQVSLFSILCRNFSISTYFAAVCPILLYSGSRKYTQSISRTWSLIRKCCYSNSAGFVSPGTLAQRQSRDIPFDPWPFVLSRDQLILQPLVNCLVGCLVLVATLLNIQIEEEIHTVLFCRAL